MMGMYLCSFPIPEWFILRILHVITCRRVFLWSVVFLDMPPWTFWNPQELPVYLFNLSLLLSILSSLPDNDALLYWKMWIWLGVSARCSTNNKNSTWNIPDLLLLLFIWVLEIILIFLWKRLRGNELQLRGGDINSGDLGPEGDGSFSKAFADHMWGPELDSPDPTNEGWMQWCVLIACTHSSGETCAGRFLDTLVSQPSMNDELQVNEKPCL